MARESVDLKEGDVVKLNSGSPELTVTRVSSGPDVYVDVSWMTPAPERKVQAARFPVVCVYKVK
jgi:uncharacterized protein YodC (DUF2158 family)